MIDSSRTPRPAGTNRRRLTVAIIARDCAKSVKSTLESVSAIADQIIVADYGSQDETASVAAQLGAEVISTPWENDLSKVRNAAWNQASGDWVLWLEPGEILSPDCAENLRQFIESQADVTKCYMLLVRASAAAGHVGGEQIGRVRLVPNFASLRFCGRVREDLLPGIAAVGLALEGLPWRIQQTDSERGPVARTAHARLELELAQLELDEQPSDARMLVAMAESLAALGDHSNAGEVYRTALRHSEAGSSEMLDAYYGLLALMDHDASRRDEQLNLCLEALQVYPFDAQLLCAMGSYLQAQQRLDLAARAYQVAVEHGQVDPRSWHLSCMSEIAVSCLTLSPQQLGRVDEAEQAYEKAIAAGLGSPRIRRQLIDLYIKLDHADKAIHQLSFLPGEMVYPEALRGAVRGACLAAKQQWAAAADYLQSAYAAGCRDTLCLRWLAATYCATGKFRVAEPIVQQWLSREPASVEARQYSKLLMSRRCASSREEGEPSAATLAGDRSFRVDGQWSDPSGSDTPHAPITPIGTSPSQLACEA